MKKRIMAMVLALVMVFALSACGSKEKEAEVALEKYFEDFIAGKINADNAGEYITDEDLKEEVISSVDTDDVLENMDISSFEAMGIELDKAAIEKSAETLNKTVLSMYSFEHDEIVLQEDGTVKTVVSITCPDEDLMEGSEEFTQEVMLEVFGFGMDDVESVFTVWAEKEGITPEELLIKYMSADEDEIASGFAKAFSEEIEALFPALFEKMGEIVKNTERKTTSYTYTLEETDGKWKITDSEEITE